MNSNTPNPANARLPIGSGTSRALCGDQPQAHLLLLERRARETSSLAPVDFRTSAFLATSVLAIWGAIRAVRHEWPGAWLFAGLMIFYPAIYYFVYPHARYRHPIEPELTILIVFLLLKRNGPQGVKNVSDFQALAARVNSCPYQNRSACSGAEAPLFHCYNGIHITVP